MERSTRRFRGAAAVLTSALMLWNWSGGVVLGSTPPVAAVPVGIVLDPTSDTGRKSLVSVAMALEDYAKRPSNAAKVELHVRDSRGDLGTAVQYAGSRFDNSKSDTKTVKRLLWLGDSVITSEGHEKIGSTDMPDTKQSEANKRRKLVGEDSGKVCSGVTKVPIRNGVPLKDGFKEFLSTSPPYSLCKNNDSVPSTTDQITGYSIDIFKTALMKLQIDPACYEFCIFKGTYDELVDNVSSGNLGGAAGDVTITSERTKSVDFTMPYTQSGVYLLVLSENDLEPIQWIFIAPLTWQLWFATMGFFFFTGFVVWVIERPRNPEYQGSILRQISTASYFAFSTLTFSHDQIIRSPLSKIVVVIWCFLVLILVQSYTASLSSLLTAERLRPSVTDLDHLLMGNEHNIGYQNGSFVQSILRNLTGDENRLKLYATKEEYADALRKGSKNGGVSAIVDEIPFLTSFLSDDKYKREFRMVDTIYKTPGFGFVFPRGSPLVHNLSTAILSITGGVEGANIVAKWLGTASSASSHGTPRTDSTPLTLQSFSGLFITSGCISFAMLVISIGRLARARWTAERTDDAQGDIDNDFDEESLVGSDTSDVSGLDRPLGEARNGDRRGSERSDDVEESRLIRSGIDNGPVPDQLPDGGASNTPHGGHGG